MIADCEEDFQWPSSPQAIPALFSYHSPNGVQDVPVRCGSDLYYSFQLGRFLALLVDDSCASSSCALCIQTGCQHGQRRPDQACDGYLRYQVCNKAILLAKLEELWQQEDG